MAKIKSEDTTPWEGFKPGRYVLDFKTVLTLPLRHLREGDSTLDSEAGTATTIEDVLVEIGLTEMGKGKKVQLDGFSDLEIKVDDKKVHLGGPTFSLDILRFICRLNGQSQNPFDSYLFWYDSDHVLDDAHDSHRFFVVHKDAIVMEGITFSQHSSAGFNPQAFRRAFESGDDIWGHAQDWREAETRYWYRKFYRETMMGQLMALRPDGPELYYFPEGRVPVEPEDEGESLLQVVATIRTEVAALSGVVRIILVLLIAVVCLLVWKR